MAADSTRASPSCVARLAGQAVGWLATAPPLYPAAVGGGLWGGEKGRGRVLVDARTLSKGVRGASVRVLTMYWNVLYVWAVWG